MKTSTFPKSYNDLGIYYIPSEGPYCSYFVKRKWGNYLYFPHPEIERMFPFIEASGGIYKVFDQTLPFPYYNQKLFVKFGAATIGLAIDYHPDFLVEKLGDEYFDVDLRIDGAKFIQRIGSQEFTFLDGANLTDVQVFSRIL